MKTISISIKLIGLAIIMAISSQACDKEEIVNQLPTCEITNPDNDQILIRGEAVTITVSASDSDGSVEEVRFLIDGEERGSASDLPYQYIWNTDDEIIGSHSIMATCIDDLNGNQSDAISVEIIEPGSAPTAAFSVDQTIGNIPLTVEFSDQSTNEPNSWLWDFGDGSTSDSPSPLHTYTSVGTFSVSLTVSNYFGSDTETKTNYITASDENSFTDPRDGQSYNILEIGSQIWFAENLNYDANNSWCYDNDPVECDKYGRLYNWLAAKEACPDGWHLPTDGEWKQLEMHLGMSSSQANEAGWRGTDEGRKLKSESGWWSNGNGTNSSGFQVLPGGNRNADGTFEFEGGWGLFWTDTPWSSNAVYRLFTYDEDRIRRFNYEISEAYSVRCIKD